MQSGFAECIVEGSVLHQSNFCARIGKHLSRESFLFACLGSKLQEALQTAQEAIVLVSSSAKRNGSGSKPGVLLIPGRLGIRI